MIRLLGSALTIATFSIFASHANAATIWEPTDNDVNVINQIGIPVLDLDGGSLALFEDTDLTFTNALVLGSAGGKFLFTDNNNGSFTVDSYVGDAYQSSITINGNEFLLGVQWGSSGYVSDSSYQQADGDPNSYFISFIDDTNSGQTLAVDLQPVPLPAAAWLFGSALLGLGALKRKKA